MNLDQWFRRCHLKIFLFFSSGGHFIQQIRTVCAILVLEGIVRNISLKLFCIWTRGSGDDVFLRYFLSTALVALLLSGAKTFVQFW